MSRRRVLLLPVVFAAAALPVVMSGPSVGLSPSVPLPKQQHVPPAEVSLETAVSRIDVAVARARAEDQPGFDLVIDRADLDQWLAAQRANPELFDGLTIGVVLEPGDSALAESVGRDVANGRDYDTLTPSELAAVNGTGGSVAMAVDARAAGAAVESPTGAAAPPLACVSMATAAPRTTGSVIVYFACQGDEPVARPEIHPIASPSTEVGRVEAALHLLAGPSQQGQEAGLYSVLSDVSGLIGSVTVTGDVITVDFRTELARLGFDHSMAGSTLFLEMVVNTVFANSDAGQLELTLGGDCQAFWRAMGGSGCHTAARGETNTEDRG